MTSVMVFPFWCRNFKHVLWQQWYDSVAAHKEGSTHYPAVGVLGKSILGGDCSTSFTPSLPSPSRHRDTYIWRSILDAHISAIRVALRVFDLERSDIFFGHNLTH